MTYIFEVKKLSLYNVKKKKKMKIERHEDN